jgi:general secretion pathway protein K
MNRTRTTGCVTQDRQGPLAPPRARHQVCGTLGGRALPRDRGAVIILVLVTIMLAAFLLTAFIRRSGTELLADARAANLKSLRADAYSALETTLAVLADFRAVDGALRSPAEGWQEPLLDAGFEPGQGRDVEVTFEDESAKLSLPNAGETEIQTMLEFAGVERNQAEHLSHVLHAWVHDAPKDASADLDVPDYTRAEPAYQAAHRALRSWGELAAVELDEHIFFDEAGHPTSVFDAFRQEVSLLSFRRVNLNSARAGVLTALGLGSGEVQALEDYRARPKPKGETGVFRSITEASTVMGTSITGDHYSTNIEALRIHVAVRQGQVVYRLSAVVSAGTNASAPQRRTEAPKPGTAETAPPPERKALNYPFTVLEIKENAEPTGPIASPTS